MTSQLSRRFSWPALALCLLVGLSLAGCGDAATPTTAPAVPTTSGSGSTSSDGAISVSLMEWGIEPKNIEATAGSQKFEVVNKGKFPHDFAIEIEGDDKKTEVLPADGKYTLETELPAGTYEIICSIPGHKDSGMIGTLVVK